MMALWMAMFFAVMTAVAWLALFPVAREGVFAGMDRLLSRLASVLGHWQSRARGRASNSSQSARASSQRAMNLFGRHRTILLVTALLVTALLLAVPPLIILQLRQQVALDGFERGAEANTNSHVLGLLRGERLAPPPELPPAVFVAAEAELLRSGAAASASEAPQAISSADRKWNRIDPAFQQRVLAIYQVMRDRYGYEMVLVEGYRSPERQAALARKGGSTTRAGAGQSCHQYGLAVDSALYRDGKLQWDMGDAWTKRGYFLYGQLAAEAGLEWGGSWRSIKDYVHLELKGQCRQARRVAGH